MNNVNGDESSNYKRYSSSYFQLFDFRDGDNFEKTIVDVFIKLLHDFYNFMFRKPLQKFVKKR